jgi:pyruvate dehydrogenase E1 component beta subunit
VAKTGRLLVAHEAVRVGGFGAEIAATVAENAHANLKAPIRRLGAPRAPISYAPNLEDEVRISADNIANAVRSMMVGKSSAA